MVRGKERRVSSLVYSIPATQRATQHRQGRIRGKGSGGSFEKGTMLRMCVLVTPTRQVLDQWLQEMGEGRGGLPDSDKCWINDCSKFICSGVAFSVVTASAQ
jgi:hypothetical protein